jgi:hypothetical protein
MLNINKINVKAYFGKDVPKKHKSNDIYTGKTIIVYLGNFEYIYIGHNIFTFKTKDVIINYYMGIDENEKILDVAIDKKGNSYQFFRGVIKEIKSLSQIT